MDKSEACQKAQQAEFIRRLHEWNDTILRQNPNLSKEEIVSLATFNFLCILDGVAGSEGGYVLRKVTKGESDLAGNLHALWHEKD